MKTVIFYVCFAKFFHTNVSTRIFMCVLVYYIYINIYNVCAKIIVQSCVTVSFVPLPLFCRYHPLTALVGTNIYIIYMSYNMTVHVIYTSIGKL